MTTFDFSKIDRSLIERIANSRRRPLLGRGNDAALLRYFPAITPLDPRTPQQRRIDDLEFKLAGLRKLNGEKPGRQHVLDAIAVYTGIRDEARAAAPDGPDVKFAAMLNEPGRS